jgi:hypothetical protein
MSSLLYIEIVLKYVHASMVEMRFLRNERANTVIAAVHTSA